MSTRKIIFLVVSLIYIAFLVFPILTSLLGNNLAIVSASTSAIIFFLYPKAIANKTTPMLLLYFIVFGLYTFGGRKVLSNIGETGMAQVYIEMGFILPSFLIMSVIDYIKDKRVNQILVYTTIVMFAISFLYLIPILNKYQTILRGRDRNDLGDIFGLPSYTLMHAYTYLVPGLLYGFRKSRGWHKWAFLAITALTIYIINATYTTTVLILAIICVIVAILYRNRSGVLSFLPILIIFGMVFFIIQSGTFDSILQKTSEFYEGTAVSGKIKDFRVSLEKGELTGGSVEGRENAHQISWDNFFENPIWGGGNAGEHSVLIDRLGSGGLLLFIPFILIFISIAKTYHKKIKTPQARYFFYLGLFCFAIILYTKGLFAAEGWLFYCVIFPQMIIVFENSESQKKILTKKKKLIPATKKQICLYLQTLIFRHHAKTLV